MLVRQSLRYTHDMIRSRVIPLQNYEKNVYSQSGEDGVIDFLLKNLRDDIADYTCVDVGAWDGVYLSNVKHQIDQGHPAILIESDETRVESARRVFYDNPRVKVLTKFIDDKSRLDLLLSEHRVAVEFLLLSIDIDGADLDVLESLGEFKPAIIVIEFNPTIPNHISFRNPKGKRVGSSAKAIFEVATESGYELVHATSTNLIFIFPNMFSLPTHITLTVETALDDSGTIKALFVGYDGTVHVSGPDSLEYPWHGLTKSLAKLELPKSVQKFRDELGLFGKIVFLWCWFKQYWRIALYSRVKKAKLRLGLERKTL